MNNHRYILEPYQSGKATRFDCPYCEGKKRFTRYLDTETGEYVADHVGKCERANECGKHYPPREYFADNKIFETNRPARFVASTPRRKAETVPVRPTVYIPVEVFKASRTGYERNAFTQYLLTLFDADTVSRLISRYQIGTAKRPDHWPNTNTNPAVLWWIDLAGNITGGQVALFDEDGHTVKYVDAKDQKQRCTRPVYKVLKRQHEKKGVPLPNWLGEYEQSNNQLGNLFGLHLLRMEPANKPIALVEAPATAIVASVYYPQFIWLAVGSLDWLTEKRLKPLQGRKVYLFPDLNGFDHWSRKATELSHLARFTVSDLLEQNATEQERKDGLDLRDYLTRFDIATFRPEEIQHPQHNTAIAQSIEPDTPPAPDVVQPAAQQWQIEELEQFFADAILPTGPVKISPCETIIDVELFVGSHLATVRRNRDKRSYAPYYERLKQLQNILTNSNQAS